MLHSASQVRLLLLVAVLAAAAAMIALAGGAAAAVHGITPLWPVDGATVPKGDAPILRMRVKGPANVFVHVCRSKKEGPSGVICGKLAGGRATRGTYHRQAFRVACTKSDCRQEGKVVRFRVG